MADQLSALDLDALEHWARLVVRSPGDVRADHGVEAMQIIALIQRLREAEQRANDSWFDEAALEARIAQLEQVLVLAAIPLEALNMDNYNGAKWMAPSVKQHVAEAIEAIRTALRLTENATSHKAGK